MSNSNNIKVYIRFKPPSKISTTLNKESIRGRESSPSHYQIQDNKKDLEILPQKISKQSISKIDSTFRPLNFSYDRIFPYNVTQFEIFECAIIPILKSVMQGHNSTIVCYGQTGSGKTYTMLGSNESSVTDTNADAFKLEQVGVIPRVFQYIFDEISNSPVTSQHTIAISYFEIYNEVIKDLLNLNKSSSIIHIREKIDVNNETYTEVDGLDKVYVGNMDDVNEILKIDSNNRQTAETKMNAPSSRSHSILRVEITASEEENPSNTCKSTLFLVDLAGSERLNKLGTQSSSSSSKETIGINSSLSVFTNVINILSAEDNKNGNKYIPYRDSKLTRVLQNSLGGNSQTAMIINCSSELDDLNETISSLRFAQRVKHIQNKTVKSIYNVDKTETNNYVKNKPTENEENNAQISKNWKIKYINALKKIIELETKVEINEHGNKKKGKYNFFDDGHNIPNSIIRKIESLETDIEISRKLLVSKTDQILQLESELESYQINNNGNNGKIPNMYYIEQDSFNVMKQMSDTIQLQNNELLQQVERAEQLVQKKEKRLKNENLKWFERNKLVINQQNGVEQKLIQMSGRLKNITKHDFGNNDNGDNKNIGHSVISNGNKDIGSQSSSNENNNSGVKKGLNLHIIKPT